MDLISRQEAIEALAEHIMESALMDNPTTASTDIDRYRPIAELSLRDVPSVQPERMRGKWIAYDGNVYMCSCCGKQIITNPDYIKEQKFCFRCGADMRGRQDG